MSQPSPVPYVISNGLTEKLLRFRHPVRARNMQLALAEYTRLITFADKGGKITVNDENPPFDPFMKIERV
jgi:hypothetical protein